MQRRLTWSYSSGVCALDAEQVKRSRQRQAYAGSRGQAATERLARNVATALDADVEDERRGRAARPRDRVIDAAADAGADARIEGKVLRIGTADRRLRPDVDGPVDRPSIPLHDVALAHADAPRRALRRLAEAQLDFRRPHPSRERVDERPLRSVGGKAIAEHRQIAHVA